MTHQLPAVGGDSVDALLLVEISGEIQKYPGLHPERLGEPANVDKGDVALTPAPHRPGSCEQRGAKNQPTPAPTAAPKSAILADSVAAGTTPEPLPDPFGAGKPPSGVVSGNLLRTRRHLRRGRRSGDQHAGAEDAGKQCLPQAVLATQIQPHRRLDNARERRVCGGRKGDREPALSGSALADTKCRRRGGAFKRHSGR